MVYCLGVGFAEPDTRIDNSFLAELGLSITELAEPLAVVERRTILELGYIRRTRNRDLREAATHSNMKPTELGLLAVKQALDQAGIRPDQIGLIIGESGTPLETTPSEAQRIGRLLGLKVPAYDVGASSATLALHSELLCSWAPDSLPDYVLSLSVNTPTCHVSYDDPNAAYFLSDGAGAMVMSPRRQSKSKLSRAEYNTSRCSDLPLYLDTYGPIRLDPIAVARQADEIGSEIPGSVIGLGRSNGFSLGTTAYRVLKEELAGARPGEEISLLFPDLGSGGGILQLTVG